MTAALLRHLHAVLGPEEGAWWVAETAGGEVVGWAEAERVLVAASRDVQRVWAAVRPDHRHRGLGARLLGVAEERALARGGRMLRSWTFADQPDGIALLRSRGHEERSVDWAKLATIRWAAANGVRQIGTGNNSANRDMLALNEHLGYRRLPGCLTFARLIGG